MKDILSLQNDIKNNSNNGKNHSHEPKAKNYCFFFPSYSFKMMMKGSDDKNFLPITEFFTRELDNNRQSFKNKNDSNNDENRKGIRKHCHESEIGSKRKTAYVSHIKFCRFYIEPEKGNQCSTNTDAESREKEKSLIIGDICVYAVTKKEQSSSKSIEPISDIDTICGCNNHKNKKRDKVYSELYSRNIRDCKSSFSPPKFIIKPPCPHKSKYKQPYHFKFCRKTFCLANTLDVHKVIYSTKKSHCKKSKETEIGFFLIPQGVIDKIKILKNNTNTYHEKNSSQYDSSSHSRSSNFVFMEFKKFKSLSKSSIFTNLFPEFKMIEEVYIVGSDDETNQKCC